jgi:AcrR family transcriptional regulator
MKSGQARQNPEELCDTVAHTPAAPAASSLPSSNLADPRAVKSSQALRAALLTLLERKPLEQITVREIAAEAGVHYATFFRHHATKEALLDDVAADQIDRLVALTLPVIDAVDWRASFMALATYVEAHRELWTTLLTGGAAGAMRAELLRVSQEVAAERAPRPSWIPVELATICTVSLIVEIVSWWLRQPEQVVSVAQVAEILYRLVLEPTIGGVPEAKA